MTLGEADCLRKGPWTVEEDIRLMSYISIHGDGRWNSLAKSSGLKRSGKSCRLRWVNYLRPDLKRGNITADEERLIIDLQRRWGNRWSRIARHLPGRTDNEIKNYWRTRIRSKFLRIRSAAAVAKSKEEVITSSSNRANLHRNEVEYNQTTSSSTTWNPIARLQTQEQEQISHASRATMNTTINNSISSSSMMNVAPLCSYSSEEKLEEGGGLIACSDKELFGSMMLAEEFLCNDGDIDIDMDGIIIGGNMRACSWSHNTYVNCGGANVVNNDTNMNMINTDSFDFP